MNALEILGVACVDAIFRKRLFSDVEGIIKENRADLTWAEEAGLRRITGKYRPRPKKGAAASLSNGPLEGEDPNTLEDELEDVEEAISRMCPEEPCPWPKYFTQNKNDPA
jgi:hypothetical protein